MRRATSARKTAETDITVTLDLDGSGRYDNRTGVGFFDHMLDQLARHAAVDMQVHCEGDGLECGLGDMVTVDPVQRIDMQGDAAMGAEGLKELAHQFGVEMADFLCGHVDIPLQIGPPR